MLIGEVDAFLHLTKWSAHLLLASKQIVDVTCC